MRGRFASLAPPAYLGGLRERLVERQGPLANLLLDFGIRGLGPGVFFLHHLPFLGVEVLELGPDFQQLVDVRLVLSDGLPQLLGNRD